MLVLKFDSERLAKDLQEELLDGADECIEYFMRDAQLNLKATDFYQFDAQLKEASNIIHAYCIFYGWSILESYGKGEYMDTEKDNEWFSTYYKNQKLGWNPARRGKPIVGRPAGEYTDFFGERKESAGTREGMSIGGYGNPREGNHAIQNSEKRLREAIKNPNGYVNEILRRHANEFIANFNPTKYFRSEEVKA